MKHVSLTCFSQGWLCVLAVLLGLLFSSSARAQQFEADRAHAALVDPGLVGEKRLQQMLIYAHAMMSVDVPAARQAFREANQEAGRQALPEFAALARFGECFAIFANEGAEETVRALDEARRLLPATASVRGRCHAALMESSLQVSLGRYGLGAKSLRAAFEHAKEGVPPELMGSLLLELHDQLYMSAAGYDPVADLREAAALFRAANDRGGEFAVQVRQAEYDYSLGREQAVLELMPQLLRTAEKRGDVCGANQVRWALYGYAMRKDQYAEGAARGEAILASTRKLKSKVAHAWALDAVAWAYILDEQIGKGSPFLKDALALSAELKIDRLEFDVVNSAQKLAVLTKDRGSVMRYSDRLRELSDPRSREKGVELALEVLSGLRSERQAVHAEAEKSERTVALYRGVATVVGGLLLLALAIVFFAGKRRAERMHAELKVQAALAKQHDRARKALEAQAAQVERLDSLGLLAAGIAHDFNNILCGIMGHAEMLAATHDGVSRESAEGILASAERASLLCNRMLDYAKPSPRPAIPEDLRRILDGSSSLLEIARPAGGVTIFENDGAPVYARVDCNGIEQVVINLVNNAHDATVGASRVVVRVREEEVLPPMTSGSWFGVRSEAPGPYAVLEVEDDGVGMQDEQLRRIFDPFYTTRLTGRGLGLSAAYGVVVGLGGVFQVESTPGTGSIFRAWFPVVVNEVSEPPLSDPAIDTESTPTAPQCVLVVDDEPALLALADRAFTASGHAVHLASSGARALEIYQEHAEDINAVFLDLGMPEMDGGEVLRRLQKSADREAVPVVVMSGHGEDYVRGRIGSHKIHSVLRKPFGLGELRRSLRLAVQPHLSPPDRGLDSAAATG